MSNPHIYQCADGSTLIEWILDDSRFYISLELDVTETSWGYATKTEGIHGTLPDEFFAVIGEYKGDH